jgi:hypothetical protein
MRILRDSGLDGVIVFVDLMESVMEERDEYVDILLNCCGKLHDRKWKSELYTRASLAGLMRVY